MSLKSYLARLFREQVRLAIIELSRAPIDDTKALNYERAALELATRDSAQYLLDNFTHAKGFASNKQVRDHALEACTVDGLMLEFGVLEGRSIKAIASTTQQEVHGFDSWEGLPEKWTHRHEVGFFSTGGKLPDMTGYPNVRLHKGWFEETLPKFLDAHPGPIRLLHIDSDLYSSAVTILTLCEARIVPGTVILFDEYINYIGWRQGEWKAWQEFVSRTGMKWGYLGFAASEYAVSVVVS